IEMQTGQSVEKETALPRITVVTPSLNQGRYIENAIRSVLEQGYPNLEYIIRDAGSTDESIEVIKRYRRQISHVIIEPDDGPADAINKAFAIATGDILAWLNADDLYLPGTLRAIADAFMAEPQADLIYGEGWYIDEVGERIEPCRFVRRKFERRYLVNKDPILQPAAFWRRSLWVRVGDLDTSLRWVFDWEWFIRAHEVGQFRYLPRNLACYRVQPKALTRTGGLSRQLEHGRITRRYGAWWYPNHIVQQMRRLDAFGQRLIGNRRQVPATLLSFPFSIPRLAAEWLLHGMYMR
ncbi:MAG TPA: glycosyltransferase family 2 protein, partial [Promineifilum sp.]|nr:glycosyltransferase family 2 protein [Promineifilum sp.]